MFLAVAWENINLCWCTYSLDREKQIVDRGMRGFNNVTFTDCSFLRFLWNEEYQILVIFILEYIMFLSFWCSFAKNFRRMKVISRIGMEESRLEKRYRKGEKRKIEERVSLHFLWNDLEQKLRPTLWSWLNDDNGHGRDPLSFPRGCVFRRSLFATVSGERGASACQFRFERFTSAGLNKQPRIHRPDQLACSRNTLFIPPGGQRFDRPQENRKQRMKINGLFQYRCTLSMKFKKKNLLRTILSKYNIIVLRIKSTKWTESILKTAFTRCTWTRDSFRENLRNRTMLFPIINSQRWIQIEYSIDPSETVASGQNGTKQR